MGYAGDPNGLMYRHDSGLYHFFWQHWPDWPSPPGVVWGHAVSRDFARWRRLPDVLSPGSFSGGATQLRDGSGGVRLLYKDTGRGGRFFTAAPANLSDATLAAWREAPAPTAIAGATDPSPGWPVDAANASAGYFAVVGALGANSSRGAAALWRGEPS